MPGRELPPRSATTRERKPAIPPFSSVLSQSKQRPPLKQQHKPKQEQYEKQEKALTPLPPACENCLQLLKCTEDVRQALEDVLSNARIIFLDDTLHHQMDDERWIRVLRALGEDKKTYYKRIVSFDVDKSVPSEKTSRVE